MIIKYDEDLSRYTTIQIGGKAKTIYFPESVDELITVIQNNKDVYFLGGGSNLLINDNKEFESVICLRNFDLSLVSKGDGHFLVGGSVRLQMLIKTINELGYGGIEYLYSVPGLVGGAVSMNAGRGRGYNKSISDYIESVTVYSEGKVEKWSKEECHFGYRTSRFKEGKAIVLSVQFIFPEQKIDVSKKLIQERIELCKNLQDNSCPNFGTVFSEANGTIMKVISKMGFGKKIGFSKKTQNWLLKKKREGSFKDAIRTIRFVETLHKITHKPIKREFITWE